MENWHFKYIFVPIALMVPNKPQKEPQHLQHNSSAASKLFNAKQTCKEDVYQRIALPKVKELIG
jgi:hypothetical protein